MTKLDKYKLSESIRLATVHLQNLMAMLQIVQEIVDRTTDWR